MSLLLMVLLAGETIKFAKPFSQQEYVDFLNGETNHAVTYDCQFTARDRKSFKLQFTQSGGHVFFREGYHPKRTSWTVGQTPIKNVLHLDDTGLMNGARVPSIRDAETAQRPVKFKSADGLTTISVSIRDALFGASSISATTMPPPIITGSNNADHDAKKRAYQVRPSALSGFCETSMKPQPPLSFAQLQQLSARSK